MNKFIKVDDLIWESRFFSIDGIFELNMKEYYTKYPTAVITEKAEIMGSDIFRYMKIAFENEDDEMQFMIRESIS